MMSQEQNDLITRTGPKDPCGKLMRMYWQPAALLDELDSARPLRPVKLLGEDLVLFRNEQGEKDLPLRLGHRALFDHWAEEIQFLASFRRAKASL